MSDPRTDAERYLRACAAVGVTDSTDVRIARGLLAALAEVDALRLTLAAERGLSAPAGWTYDHDGWRRLGASVTRRPFGGWRWCVWRAGGPILRDGECDGALEGIEAAERALGEVPRA